MDLMFIFQIHRHYFTVYGVYGKLRFVVSKVSKVMFSISNLFYFAELGIASIFCARLRNYLQ